MDYKIIDFHTHPFLNASENICNHKQFFTMDVDTTRETFEKLGVSHICGSVISVEPLKENESIWDRVQANNQTALTLAKYYQGFYIPGFHIHPDYKTESLNEIEKMSGLGVKILGELVPYIHHYQGYAHKNLDEILDCATEKNMLVSIHSMGNDEMDEMVKRHKDTLFIAAHPGEYGVLMRHIARAKWSENYYIDLSGYGMFRHGMLRRLIDEIGVDKILFGSDYPTCNPAMYIGGVLLDDLITPEEKQKIFYDNAKRLLGLE